MTTVLSDGRVFIMVYGGDLSITASDAEAALQMSPASAVRAEKCRHGESRCNRCMGFY